MNKILGFKELGEDIKEGLISEYIDSELKNAWMLYGEGVSDEEAKILLEEIAPDDLCKEKYFSDGSIANDKDIVNRSNYISKLFLNHLMDNKYENWNDNIMINEDFNNWTDSLCKDGEISTYEYESMGLEDSVLKEFLRQYTLRYKIRK